MDYGQTFLHETLARLLEPVADPIVVRPRHEPPHIYGEGPRRQASSRMREDEGAQDQETSVISQQLCGGGLCTQSAQLWQTRTKIRESASVPNRRETNKEDIASHFAPHFKSTLAGDASCGYVTVRAIATEDDQVPTAIPE